VAAVKALAGGASCFVGSRLCPALAETVWAVKPDGITNCTR